MDTPRKRFLKYASFNIMGMMGISFYILADTFFIANGIGPEGLAALNLAIPVYSFIHGSALMLGIGGATKYIVAKCQGEHRRANSIFSSSMRLGWSIFLVFILCGLFFSSQLTNLLKADAALFDMTNTYLKVILLFSPFFITNEQLLAYVRSDGNPSLAMTAMVSGSIANIILDYIFIYPLQMGILGAVLATGIAPIVSISILSYHLFNPHCGFRLVREPIRFKIAREVTILGLPTLVTELSTGIVMIVFNLLFMQLGGNMGVAAYGIVANIAIVTTSIFTGLAQGVQPLISEANSTANRKLLKAYIRYSFIGAIVLSLLLYVLMYRYTSPITALFNNESNTVLQKMGESGMYLYFTSLPFTACNIIFCAIFTSVERPLPAQIVSLLRGLIIILPLSVCLAQQFGMDGVWLSVTATELLTTVLAVYLWFKYFVNKIPAP